MLIIQEITTLWTIKSRGAPGAVDRNRVPEALLVPKLIKPISAEAWIYHRAEFGERDQFQAPTETVQVLTPFELTAFGILAISGVKAYFLIDIDYAAWKGAPRRDYQRRHAFQLRLSETGTVKYNWRTSVGDIGYWAYQKSVIHVGWLDRYSRSVFTDQKATHQFEDMSSLW